MNTDLHHLNLLSIFHYVAGGLTCLFGCFPIIHLIVGLFLLFAPPQTNGGEEFSTSLVGVFFILFALGFIVMAWTTAIFMFIAGRKLARQRSYTFCLAIAGVECIFMPIGTVLGVFTIIVLSRPSVKALFSAPAELLERGSVA